jgi:hypothetical protein
MGVRIFKSAVIGMVLAIAVGVLAYALAPFFDAVGIYAAPGIVFLPLIPSKLGYWLKPNGGAAVGIFVLLLCATFCWTILFGAAYFGWVSLRLRRR